jgi:cold shock protein
VERRGKTRLCAWVYVNFGLEGNTTMQTGIVKWFNEAKGFGFIASENKDYFVYFKEILGTGFKTLKEGQHVQFNASTSAKGPVAQGVSVIEK